MALPGYSLRGRGVKTTTGLFIDTEATAPFPPFGIRRNPQCWDLRFTPLQGLAKLRRRSPDIGYASFSRDDAACLLARRNRVISLEKTPSRRCVKQSLEFLIECIISPRRGVANPAINNHARTENYVLSRTDNFNTKKNFPRVKKTVLKSSRTKILARNEKGRLICLDFTADATAVAKAQIRA